MSRHSFYQCPNCGNDETPIVKIRCAEHIRFYHCRRCDFSSWDSWSFGIPYDPDSWMILFQTFAEIEVAANAFGWSLDRAVKVVENPPK